MEAATLPRDAANAQNDHLYDIVVVGGGINGAGIARDAAGRGAKVLLVEARDLASGTSSASSKLIHGGLRYLEHREFALVREALGERETLWGIAPHIIYPMRFVLPHVKGLRPRWLLRLGLFLYDHLGGRRKLPGTEAIDLGQHPAGVPLKPDFRKGFVYSDCWADDARLVILNARDAADRGAEVRTRSPVTGFRREGEIWRIDMGEDQVRARALVNAAGPGALDLLALGEMRETRRMRLVRGSHIIVPRLFDHDFAYFFQLADGRIFFAIPYERDFTLIGTTDADHSGSLDQIAASDEEIAYICEGANRFFKRSITPSDVVWSYAGVRPLIDDGAGKPEAATRGYKLEISEQGEGAPLLNVFGGKLTVYRHLAEDAVDLLTKRLKLRKDKAWTGTEPLPGADFPTGGFDRLVDDLRARFTFFDDFTVLRIAHAYGTDAFRIFASPPERGRDFGCGLFQQEVDHLLAREWARTVEDILWRRTKLGLRLDAEQRAELQGYIEERKAA